MQSRYEFYVKELKNKSQTEKRKEEGIIGQRFRDIKLKSLPLENISLKYVGREKVENKSL